MINEVNSLALVEFSFDVKKMLIHGFPCTQLIDQKQVFFIFLVIEKFADILPSWRLFHLSLQSWLNLKLHASWPVKFSTVFGKLFHGYLSTCFDTYPKPDKSDTTFSEKLNFLIPWRTPITILCFFLIAQKDNFFRHFRGNRGCRHFSHWTGSRIHQ